MRGIRELTEVAPCFSDVLVFLHRLDLTFLRFLVSEAYLYDILPGFYHFLMFVDLLPNDDLTLVVPVTCVFRSPFISSCSKNLLSS